MRLQKQVDSGARNMIQYTRVVATAFLVILAAMPSMSWALHELKISYVFDGPWEKNKFFQNKVTQEVNTLLEGLYVIKEQSQKIYTGQWTQKSIRTQLKKAASDSSRLIITMGIISSQEAAYQREHKKITIAPFLFDHRTQKAPYDRKNNSSGKKNFYYLESLKAMKSEIFSLREISPFKNLGILFSQKVLQSSPNLASFLKNPDNDWKTQLISLSDQNTGPLLPEGIDALYIGPSLPLDTATLGRLNKELREKKIPSFCFEGKALLKLGFLAGKTQDSSMLRIERLARKLALSIEQLLQGYPASKLPVSYSPTERTIINIEAAQAINLAIPWKVLDSATTINEFSDSPQSTQFNLNNFVKTVLENNLKLNERKALYESANENTFIARTKLFPQIQASLEGRRIDDDLARASLGTQPEDLIEGRIELTQVIFNEKLWAHVGTQEKLKLAEKYKMLQSELDLVLESSTAYINHLKLKKLLLISEENLKNSRAHHKQALKRKTIGVGKDSEIYRWNIELAKAKKQWEQAKNKTKLSQLQINNLLAREHGQKFILEDLNKKTTRFLSANLEVTQLFKNDQHVERLSALLLKLSRESSPEIKILESTLSAQKRSLWSARNSFWTPSIALKAAYSRELYKSSNSAVALPPPLNTLSLPQADQDNWSVGLKVSLPIFSGGQRIGQLRKEASQLKAIRIKKNYVEQHLEKNIRSLVYNLKSKLHESTYAQEAAESAEKNYELVRKAYSRGATSITQLLDAQQASVSANINSSSISYDLYLENIKLGRAMGYYAFIDSPQNQKSIIKKIKTVLNGDTDT